MKFQARRLFPVLAVAAVVASGLPMLRVWRPAPEPNPGGASATTRRIVVDLRDGTDAATVSDLQQRYGLTLHANSIEAAADGVMVATLPAGRDEGALLRGLNAEPSIEAAEPEIDMSVPETRLTSVARTQPRFTSRPPAASGRGFRPNDPRYGEQWNFGMVGAEQAWTRSRGRGVTVAVIDTGIAYRDSERGPQARDFKQSKFVPGYDFVHHDDNPYDDALHGTHVAGTIAESTNNNEGVAGLAFEARLMPVKVLNQYGSGTSEDVADGIRFAADHGADIINMSLGSMSPSRVVRDAVRYAHDKGVLIVCAAGNGFGPPVAYPAAFPECVAVSSVGPTGELAVYSSYGAQVALAAPGGDMSYGMENGILQNTVWPREQGGRGDDYYFFNGTSMACPHVAAVAALVMAQGVRDLARVRDALLRSCRTQAPRVKFGAGLLSADGATALVAHDRRWAMLKPLLFLAGLGLLLAAHPLPAQRRLGLALAFTVGAFEADLAARHFGADSPWNLLCFSALIPFLLFWEWEQGYGSRAVMALALGTAFCLGASPLSPLLSPFTPSQFGLTVWPWVIANALAALFIAGVAWVRSEEPAE